MPPTQSTHLMIGSLVFPQMDQYDFTGPFEILSRLPDSTFHVLWKDARPVRDVHGLLITPETTFDLAPPLDVLVVPGGAGQQAWMEDEVVLSFLRRQASGARFVFSVCTGALLCGAAGLLRGVRATTHWAALPLLKYFGATPVQDRVVLDGKIVSAAGVTAGLDGALLLASKLRGDAVARQIQLAVEYDPTPPFDSGTPLTASAETLEAARAALTEITQARLSTARRFARQFGLGPFPGDETAID